MKYLEQDQPLDQEQQAGQPFVAPGFEEVEAAFNANFAQRGEVGAACAIYHHGRLVVDLWGGYRDLKARAPWNADTLTGPVSSTTKGMAALAVALANSRGLIDYEERVATYWPEFAQQGKGTITVRQLLAHQAGLAVCDEPLTADILADPDALAAVLARQRPAWEPGTRSGYHFHTLGMYESELIRRADPRHRRLGRFFHEEVAVPLGLEFYIGLPPDVPVERIAAPIVFNAKEVILTRYRGVVECGKAGLKKGDHSLSRDQFGKAIPSEICDDSVRWYLVREMPL